jgi:hypothetical protein
MRGQYAVTIIVLALLGLFIMYLLLSTPYERYCMLTGDCENDTNGGTNGGIGGGTPVPGSIYTTSVGWIGGTDGDKIGSTHILNNIATSHLIRERQVDFLSELSLSPNVFFFFPFAQWRQFDVTVDDLNVTESIDVSFTLESEVWNPLVELLFNGAVVESRDMAADESLAVSITDFTETNTVTIRCSFQGFAFFGSQTCNFKDVLVLNKEYEDQVVDTQTVLLSSQEQTAPVIKMIFWVEEIEESGELEVYLNSALLYKGLPEAGNNTIESNDITLSDSNTVEFRAARGVGYTITKVDIELYSEIEPKDTKVINLPDNVANQIRASEDGVRFVLTVTDVQVDGLVYFTLFPAHITHPADVMEGSVFTDVEADEIDTIANTIRIESPDAKFYASEFKIVPR